MRGFPSRYDQLEIVTRKVVLLGTGASVPTKQIGAGITVTRGTAGLYTLTWKEFPGNFEGLTFGMFAATPGNLAGWSVVATTPAALAKALVIQVYDGSNAAADLAAGSQLTLNVDHSLSGDIIK